jgi:hypothetical protein
LEECALRRRFYGSFGDGRSIHIALAEDLLLMPAVMQGSKKLKVESFGSSPGFQMLNKLAYFLLRGGYYWPPESVITGLKGGTRHLYG